MTDGTPANNIVVGYAGVILAAVVTLFCTWGSFSTASIDLPMGFKMPGGMNFDITGLNGHISMMGIKLPTWLLAVLIAVGGSLGVTNASGSTRVPSAIIRIVLGVPLVFALFGMITLASEGALGIGILLAAGASIAGLVLSFK